MGVKSTQTLTRSTAEEHYVELYVEAKIERAKIKARSKVALLSDKELEDELERLNDEANDGEGFENYIISEQAESRW